MASSCDHGNEPLGSIKDGELLNNLATISYPEITLPLEVS